MTNNNNITDDERAALLDEIIELGDRLDTEAGPVDWIAERQADYAV